MPQVQSEKNQRENPNNYLVQPYPDQGKNYVNLISEFGILTYYLNKPAVELLTDLQNIFGP